MDICIMTGARPNFIKVAPIIRAIKSKQAAGAAVNYSLVYAGAEDDPTLESSLFEDLQMPSPDVYLGVTSDNTNVIASQVTEQFEKYLQEHKTDVVIVVDDLASTMAASIVAKKQGIRLAHLVAGTRSFDINMPKEINRLVIDGISDLLFTAGSNVGTTADPSKIYQVGNILMDTLRFNHDRFVRPAILADVTDAGYGVLTLNRKALLADEDKLKALLAAIEGNSGGLRIFAPLRPDAATKVASLLSPSSGIQVVSPLSYLEFGYLTSHARVIITDSGNVAEEATFNNVPCVTLNNYTEHIETVKQGTNILVNEDPELLSATLADIVAGNIKPASVPDRWDGRTADRIISALV